MTREPDLPAEVEQQTPRRPPAPLQWNLSTLFLLTAAVAVWAGYFRYRQVIPDLNRQIEVMRQVTPEIRFWNPKQIQVAQAPSPWRDRRAWDICLPAGDYAIRLATHKVEPWTLAPVAAESQVQPGLHRIELQQSDDRSRFTVLVDGRTAIDLEEVSLRGAGPSHSVQVDGDAQPPDKPVLLFWELFDTSMLTPTEGAANGLVLWIESIDPAR